MITCPKCNKELSEGTKFCDSCGTPIYETIFCPDCGEQTSTEFAFCPHCGASITEKPAADQPISTPAEKKKFPKKVILFGGIGVAVIAVLIAVISLFPGGSGVGGKSSSNYALYLKDQEIFFTDLKKDSEAWQLTARLVDSSDIDNENLSYFGYDLGFYTYMSEDGKYIFFPDKMSDDDDGLNLYYKEVANPEADAVKIDSDIQSYTVNTSATIVTYLKGEEGNLYQYNIDEDSKDKIAGEVRRFRVSDDGKKIVYISENSIYLKYAGKDKEKIASDVSSFEHVTEDFTTVYYVKDDSLYKQVEGEDKVKIASDDGLKVLKIYDSGEIYYSTNESGEISLMDYVIDDMKDADASITEPTYPDYPDSPSCPSRWDYDTDAEYDAAYAAYEDAYAAYEEEYDRLYAEYLAAYQAYWAKESRDELREALEDETLYLANYSLCFFNGMEKIVITDAFIYDYFLASDAPVISYEAYNRSSLDKVKLSDIESIDEVKDLVEAALFSSSEWYVTVKDTATVIEQEKEAGHFRINSSGTIVYYFDNIPDGKNYGELYCISISDGVVGKPEVYDSDVYAGTCYFVSDSEFMYFKDYKDGNGDLYINKKRVDYDIRIYYTVGVYTDLNEIIYFTDWDSEEECGTLKVYQGEKAVKIADDVHNFSVTPDGRVLYLYDYSLNYYRGELHEWNNGETRKIDDDVICVLSILEDKYRGYGNGYGW